MNIILLIDIIMYSYMKYQLITVIITIMLVGGFKPSWKIWVNGKDYPIYYGK